MGNIDNNGKGKGAPAPHNDGQKNYQHSNQHNPDNIRDNTRDYDYKEYDETLTNDENYNVDNKNIKGNPDFHDTKQNVDKNK
ncbi:MAG: hypothetical protein V4548_00405 [Bacteroidota bacterium]